MNTTFIRATLVATLALFAGVAFAAPAVDDPCKPPPVVHKAKKKAVKKAVKPAPSPETPIREKVEPIVPTCSADGCGNTIKKVVETTIVERVTEIRDTCIANGVKYPVVDNVCQVPAVIVPLPTKVEPNVTATCPACNSRPTVQVPASAPVAQTPVLNITGHTPRTDGRCVVKVEFNGSGRFIRLSPENNTGRLMAAIVDNEKAEWNRNNPIAYVGADDVFLHANPTCQAAVEGFSSTRSYTSTIRRLGMPGCTFVGRV